MASLDRTSPLPLWAQLAADLRERIAASEFDERFPTDEELVRHYGVSRQTVRQAVRDLGEAGMVERQRGRGSFLRRPPALELPVGAFYSLARSIVERGLEEHSHVLAFRSARDASAAARLRLGPEAALTLLERLRFAGDEPLALDRSWLPADIGAALDPVALETGSLYEAIAARANLRVTGGSERIRAAAPDAATRKLLALPGGEAVLVIERLALAGERPVEWRVSTVRGDRFSFTAEWPGAQDRPAPA